MNERRRTPRRFRGPSLEKWLASVANSHCLPSLVLADRDGLLVASTLSRGAAEEMAVAARLMADGAVRAYAARPADVRVLRVAGQDFYLGASGNPEQARLGLRDAAIGVRRILSEGR